MNPYLKKKIYDYDNPPFDPTTPYFEMCTPVADPVRQRKGKKTPKIKLKSQTSDAKCVCVKSKKSSKKLDKEEEVTFKEQRKFTICKRDIIVLPSLVDVANIPKIQEIESPFLGPANVTPRKPSHPSRIVRLPKQPPMEVIRGTEPIIVKAKLEDEDKIRYRSPVDSFGYVYDEKYRKNHLWYRMHTAPSKSDLLERRLSAILAYVLDDENLDGEQKSLLKTWLETGGDEEEDEGTEKGSQLQDLSKMSTRAKSALSNVSQVEDLVTPARSRMSAATSVDTQYRADLHTMRFLDAISDLSSEHAIELSRMMEKCQDQREPKRFGLPMIGDVFVEKDKMGPKDKEKRKFYFGVRIGGMSLQCSEISDQSRHVMVMSTVVVAYAYSSIKHPARWHSADLDLILQISDVHHRQSLIAHHVHGTHRILNKKELLDTVTIQDRPLRFVISEPHVAGVMRSHDPRILGLAEGLEIFFEDHSAGVVEWSVGAVLVWRRKFFYVFDAAGRDRELRKVEGDDSRAVLVVVYDLSGVVLMLHDRGGLRCGEPFTISQIQIIRKITDINAEGFEEISPGRAVIRGRRHLGDRCWGTARGLQSLSMALACLAYSQVTPAAAWTTGTVDKVMVLGQQLHLEICALLQVDSPTLCELPGAFTMGTLVVEMTIYGNQFAGQLRTRPLRPGVAEALDQLMDQASRCMLEVENDMMVVWQERGVFYLFDPYSRDAVGKRTTEGVSCLTMVDDTAEMADTLLNNYPLSDASFRMHVVKVLKVYDISESNKDPDEFELNRKTVTVDLTVKAVIERPSDAWNDPSILEVSGKVASLDSRYLPVFPRPHTVTEPKEFIDLDSPSLSDTQIPPPSADYKADPALVYLDEVLKEEQEIAAMGEGVDIPWSPSYEDISVQIGRDKVPFTMSEEVNTELTAVEGLTRVLMKEAESPDWKQDSWKEIERLNHEVIRATQSEELAKPSNYLPLPDGFDILHGTVHTRDIQLANYAAAMAVVTSKKYALNTWSSDVIDFVLAVGQEVLGAVQVDLGVVKRVEISRMAMGSTHYQVVIKHVFDSLLEPRLLEDALRKIVFWQDGGAVVITKKYTFAVFLKNNLYFMYDPFVCSNLGIATEDEGFSCVFRFKSLHDLVRKLIHNKMRREDELPKEGIHFIINSVKVKELPLESVPEVECPEVIEMAEEKAKKRKLGYKLVDGMYVIYGTRGLGDRQIDDTHVHSCHFACACAMLTLFNTPINKWDAELIDASLQRGEELLTYVDSTLLLGNRTIRNLQIDCHFFDIIIKQLILPGLKEYRNFPSTLRKVSGKHKYLMMQTAAGCRLIINGRTRRHLFDPYGCETDKRATWFRFDTIEELRKWIGKEETEEDVFFFTIRVAEVRRAQHMPKVACKIAKTKLKKRPHKEAPVFDVENEDWLVGFPVVWSRMTKMLACGAVRGNPDYKWFDWYSDLPGDLYTLFANHHEQDSRYPPRFRGRQTPSNCLHIAALPHLYILAEWNSSLIDSVLQAGNDHFIRSFEMIMTEITENSLLRVTDLIREVKIGPVTLAIEVVPLIEGTMFTDDQDIFNLAKAFRFFFESPCRNSGVLVNAERGRCLAFGRGSTNEYFVFDSQTVGPPMFAEERTSVAYVLRCLSLRRLVHVITVILRGGSFYIYQVDVKMDERETKITDLGEDNMGEEE